MSKIKIGLIQVVQREEDDYQSRTDVLIAMARRCFEEGADLVFFPEAYQHVPDRGIIHRREDMLRTSQAWKARCSALAREYGAYLVPWDYEIRDGKIYNASYILDRNGVEIGRYRKVHLTHGEQERGLSNGEDFPVFDLDFGKLGIMICWDNYFPESARCLGNRGAQLVVYPLYGDTLDPQWELKLRTRAIDNAMHIACCQIDTNCVAAYTGLVGPDGTVLAQLPKEPCYRVIEIDVGTPVITHTTGHPDYRENIRDMTQRCRRPDAYGALLEAPVVKSWEDVFYGHVPQVSGLPENDT